jgi:hypothetical protein
VLVSSTLRDLVIGSRLEFDDRGVKQLKDVPGEWQLFAVEEHARIGSHGQLRPQGTVVPPTFGEVNPGVS